MADQEQPQFTQEELFGELKKSDVKVSGETAEKMKENINKMSTGQPWLGLGVHDVFIKSVELAKAGTGTLGIKFKVENENGQGEVTMWLSEAALPYTIENVSRLVVHNAGQPSKEAARTYMANVTGAKEVFEVAKEKLTDGVAFLQVREARDGSTYKSKDGEEKPSLERNLLSYKPRSAAPVTVDSVTNDEPLDPKALPF